MTLQKLIKLGFIIKKNKVPSIAIWKT